MEHSRLKNYTLAEEFLKAAQDICPDDPLLENELGYLYYKRKQWVVGRGAEVGTAYSKPTDTFQSPLSVVGLI